MGVLLAQGQRLIHRRDGVPSRATEGEQTGATHQQPDTEFGRVAGANEAEFRSFELRDDERAILGGRRLGVIGAIQPSQNLEVVIAGASGLGLCCSGVGQRRVVLSRKAASRREPEVGIGLETRCVHAFEIREDTSRQLDPFVG